MRRLLGVTVLFVLGCAGTSRARAGAVARPAGCAIEVVAEGVPSRPVRAVGQVVARCVGAAAHDEARCMRELQDRACQLGAEVIWGVGSQWSGEEERRMRASAGVYVRP